MEEGQSHVLARRLLAMLCNGNASAGDTPPLMHAGSSVIGGGAKSAASAALLPWHEFAAADAHGMWCMRRRRRIKDEG